MNVDFRAFDGATDWGWVCEQVPILRVEDTGGIMAFNTENDELLGACIWDNWTKNTVQCHFMITNKMVLKHGFIQEVSDFIFHKMNRKKIYGLVPSNREKALRLNSHIGFTVKSVLEDGFDDGVDYILMELKKENCRYLQPQKVAA